MQYEYGKAIFTGQTLEVYRFERAPKVATSRKPRRIKTDAERLSSSLERRNDNIRRLRRGFLRLVSTNLHGNGAPAFLTLTFAANTTLDVGLECFREFNRYAKKEFGSSFCHISVPEFQKRGAIHFHCLVWGLEDKYVKTEKHTRFLQTLWARGFVDCVATDGSPKLAGYLGKYMSKTMQDLRLRGEKAYYTSRNVLRPLSYGSASLDRFLGIVIPNQPPSHEHEFGTYWLGLCNYQSYIKVSHESNLSGTQEDQEQSGKGLDHHGRLLSGKRRARPDLFNPRAVRKRKD